jgi:hypothetical protein
MPGATPTCLSGGSSARVPTPGAPPPGWPAESRPRAAGAAGGTAGRPAGAGGGAAGGGVQPGSTLAAATFWLALGHRCDTATISVRAPLPAAGRVVYATAKKAGLPTDGDGVSARRLRHAHATPAREPGGVGGRPIKATLGGASVATARTYPHARPTAGSALRRGP